MATIQGLTKDRMLQIEAASIVSATVDASSHLILTKYDSSTIDAGLLNVPNTVTVKNNTGSTITKGTVVYVSGSSGTNVLISKSKADAESTSSKTLGFVLTDITNGSTGQVVTEGIITGLNTSAAAAGDAVWLSPTTAGAVVYGLANKPVAPYHMVYLGVVVRSNINTGEIYVNIQNGFELDELHDVSATTPSAGDILVRNSTNTLWVNTQKEGRNALINGGFDIWQRGTASLPVATSTANGFTADRWQLLRTGLASGFTADQVTGTDACKYALRATRTVGNTSLATTGLYQTLSMSDSELYIGKQVTFSFWARTGSAFAGTFAQRILYGTGSDLGVNVAGFGATAVVSVQKTLTTSWARYSVTGTIPTNATQFAVGCYYIPSTATAVANDYFEITGAQLEIGSSPSIFQTNGGNVGAELNACMRYYQRHGLVSGAHLAMGYGNATTSTPTLHVLSPAMRVAPTSVGYNALEIVDGAGTTFAAVSMSLSNPTPTRALVNFTSGAANTAHRPYSLRTTSAAGYIEFNAEL
jgi:hypothetical protein